MALQNQYVVMTTVHWVRTTQTDEPVAPLSELPNITHNSAHISQHLYLIHASKP